MKLKIKWIILILILAPQQGLLFKQKNNTVKWRYAWSQMFSFFKRLFARLSLMTSTAANQQGAIWISVYVSWSLLSCQRVRLTERGLPVLLTCSDPLPGSPTFDREEHGRPHLQQSGALPPAACCRTCWAKINGSASRMFSQKQERLKNCLLCNCQISERPYLTKGLPVSFFIM